MNNVVSFKGDKTLGELAKSINDKQNQIDSSAESMVDYAIGIGAELHEAKSQVEHGEWLTWIEENLVVDRSQTSKYMKISTQQKLLSNIDSNQHLDIDGALKHIRSIEKQQKLDAMTPTERKAEEAKQAKKAVDKKAKAAAKSVELVEPVADIQTYINTLANIVPASVKDNLYPTEGEMPSFAYIGLMEIQSKLQIALGSLNAKQSKEMMKAVTGVLEYQSAVFEEIVKATRPKKIIALEAKLKKAIEAEKDKRDKITKDNIVTPQFAFSKTEIKQIRSVLHSDREATKERKEAAYKIFTRVFK